MSYNCATLNAWVGVHVEESLESLQARLRELHAVYSKTSQLHQSSYGTVRREIAGLMQKLRSQIEELERQIEAKRKPS
jgi:ElaB/YqjD/DUF883 family membrane-anchored ribosome-binding protein